MSSIRAISKLRIISPHRAFSQKPTGGSASSSAAGSAKPAQAAQPTGPNPDVPGLTSYVVVKKPAEVKPNDPYKVPEYFCYDRFSYHGAEVELAKYRCPQPSAKEGSY